MRLAHLEKEISLVSAEQARIANTPAANCPG